MSVKGLCLFDRFLETHLWVQPLGPQNPLDAGRDPLIKHTVSEVQAGVAAPRRLRQMDHEYEASLGVTYK